MKVGRTTERAGQDSWAELGEVSAVHNCHSTCCSSQAVQKHHANTLTPALPVTVISFPLKPNSVEREVKNTRLN